MPLWQGPGSSSTVCSRLLPGSKALTRAECHPGHGAQGGALSAQWALSAAQAMEPKKEHCAPSGFWVVGKGKGASREGPGLHLHSQAAALTQAVGTGSISAKHPECSWTRLALPGHASPHELSPWLKQGPSYLTPKTYFLQEVTRQPEQTDPKK